MLRFHQSTLKRSVLKRCVFKRLHCETAFESSRERDRLRILSKPSNIVKKTICIKTSLCPVFMAAISSCITKIDDRKTFWLLIRYARLKLKTYVPSRAKRMSPLFDHQGLYSDRRIHVFLVHKFLSCSPRIAL